MSDYSYGTCDKCGRGVTSSVVAGKLEHNFVVRLQGYGNPVSPRGVFCDDCDHLNQIREQVADAMLDSMFGDGFEIEYVRFGTDITGTYQMADLDVVYEFLAQYEEDTEDPLVSWANAWYTQHKPATVPAPVHIHWSVEMTHGTDITTTHILSGPDLASLGAMLNQELKDVQVLIDGGAYAPLTKLVVTLTEQ